MPDDLISRARSGDHAAFTALASSASNRMFAVAIRILRDRAMAEDAVQDTLVEVWRDLRALRDLDRFEAWSTRILVRICHRAARGSRASVSLTDDGGARAPDQYRRLDDRDQLERGFRRITVQQRTVLVLRHYLGLEPTEIGDRLGMSPGTVRSRLHYAHRALRAALEADERTTPKMELIE